MPRPLDQEKPTPHEQQQLEQDACSHGWGSDESVGAAFLSTSPGESQPAVPGPRNIAAAPSVSSFSGSSNGSFPRLDSLTPLSGCLCPRFPHGRQSRESSNSSSLGRALTKLSRQAAGRSVPWDGLSSTAEHDFAAAPDLARETNSWAGGSSTAGCRRSSSGCSLEEADLQTTTSGGCEAPDNSHHSVPHHSHHPRPHRSARTCTYSACAAAVAEASEQYHRVHPDTRSFVSNGSAGSGGGGGGSRHGGYGETEDGESSSDGDEGTDAGTALAIAAAAGFRSSPRFLLRTEPWKQPPLSQAPPQPYPAPAQPGASTSSAVSLSGLSSDGSALATEEGYAVAAAAEEVWQVGRCSTCWAAGLLGFCSSGVCVIVVCVGVCQSSVYGVREFKPRCP